MDKLLLIKIITLLYRESLLNDPDVVSSREPIKVILDGNRKSITKYLGGEAEMIRNLHDFIQDIINNPEMIDKHNLLQSLELLCKEDKSLLTIINKYINLELDDKALHRSIKSLRSELDRYYKHKEIANTIEQAHYTLKKGNLTIPLEEFVNKIIINLESLSSICNSNDKAIVNEVDIEETDNMHSLLVKAKKQSMGDGRFKTGWLELNEMLGGGFRLGETVLLSALQHNFKSGFVKSLFAQLCTYNKPVITNKDKKPLNLFISFEDDTDITLEFFYKYLYYEEHGKLPNLSEIDPTTMSSYIKDKLTVNGYNIKLLRVNPSGWSYKDLLNKILNYEKVGYEINVVITDYLSKLPLKGCDNSGPMGTAFRDMLTRVRDFMSSKNILYITPHQMSVDAKQLIRNGVPADQLVREVANKGYYEGSRQLDQVVDLELYQHIAKVGRQYWLTVQRGKRRYPEIIDDEKKYFKIPFPASIPCIPPNLNTKGDYIGFSYCSTTPQGSRDSDGFDF